MGCALDISPDTTDFLFEDFILGWLLRELFSLCNTALFCSNINVALQPITCRVLTTFQSTALICWHDNSLNICPFKPAESAKWAHIEPSHQKTTGIDGEDACGYVLTLFRLLNLKDKSHAISSEITRAYSCCKIVLLFH